jgi:hypothetical protein
MAAEFHGGRKGKHFRADSVPLRLHRICYGQLLDGVGTERGSHVISTPPPVAGSGHPAGLANATWQLPWPTGTLLAEGGRPIFSTVYNIFTMRDLCDFSTKLPVL